MTLAEARRTQLLGAGKKKKKNIYIYIYISTAILQLKMPQFAALNSVPDSDIDFSDLQPSFGLGLHFCELMT